MITCSKREGDGRYRKFVVDDATIDDWVPVKTYMADDLELVADTWRPAGAISRVGDGLGAAVLKTSRLGSMRRAAFVKLDRVFPNEVAALVAIAISYDTAILELACESGGGGPPSPERARARG